MSTDEAHIREQILIARGWYGYYTREKTVALYRELERKGIAPVFDAIPILLTNNQPGLPGYVRTDNELPGMRGFSPDQKALHLLQFHFPQALVKYAPPENDLILMFALMGSSGTVAFNDASDLDFWLCFDGMEMRQETLAGFQEKCTLIQGWLAAEYNLEVHFYLNDINAVRAGRFDEESDEYFRGLTLGRLLTEEFFRSSVHLHGRIPFWWVVPANASDAEYARWYGIARGMKEADTFVDLGNLSRIGSDDYLIAALFQILKSLGNPFKAIMKLGLLEHYLQNMSNDPYVSSLIKNNVIHGKLEAHDIDSYLIMFDQLYGFYSALGGEQELMDLLKQSFYLKVDPQLSGVMDNAAMPMDTRQKLLLPYVQQWHWSSEFVKKLDSFPAWELGEIERLWTLNKNFILSRYRNILKRTEDHTLFKRLPAEVLEGINNKVYSYYSVAKNKIDHSLPYKLYPVERVLRIQFLYEGPDDETWSLYKNEVSASSLKKVLIHREKSLIGLLAWIALNRMFQKNQTRLEIGKSTYQADTVFLRDLVADLSARFLIDPMMIRNSYYLREPFPLLSYLIINPYSKYREGMHDFIHLYHNSWNEVKFDRYQTWGELAEVVSRILAGAARSGSGFESAVRIVASEPFRSNEEFQRLEKVVRDLFGFFIHRKSGIKKKYITRLGNSYFVFSFKMKSGERVVEPTAIDSEMRLLYHLSRSNGTEQALRFDFTVPELGYLRSISEHARNEGNNAIRIYLQQEKKYAYFFVADERGNLFFYRKNADDCYDYLARLHAFAGQVVAAAREQNPESPIAGSEHPVRCFRVKRTFTTCEISAMRLENILAGKRKAAADVPCVVAVHFLDDGATGYRFTLPDGTYTEVLDERNIVQVADELRRLMASVPGYSYFATGINLQNLPGGMYRNFTSFAFTEKNRFELLVEKGLKETRS